jgi:hypothetical protein
MQSRYYFFMCVPTYSFRSSFHINTLAYEDYMTSHIKMDLREVESSDMDWIRLGQVRDQLWDLVSTVICLL